MPPQGKLQMFASPTAIPRPAEGHPELGSSKPSDTIKPPATLIATLQPGTPAILVIDMVENGLDEGSQEALMTYLRNRGSNAQPLFLLTRSSAILDLTAVGRDETIILCPANHSPPIKVAPYPGAPGYEAVATCLAPPDVRARTQGVIAWQPRNTQTS